ncbi:MAG: addiction module protein [Opitutus sp.]|nr:addiction module protein [Opitutus sp.]MCS6277663.1 addiction module protein [Opitutus sp.]MCS6300781.1 addiction module protein [Opitutus sp.]
MATVTLPLSRMSVAQKLGTMERIWDSLAKDEEQLPVPAWHLELLEARQQAVAQGKAQFTDWAEAKECIRRRVRS